MAGGCGFGWVANNKVRFTSCFAGVPLVRWPELNWGWIFKAPLPLAWRVVTCTRRRKLPTTHSNSFPLYQAQLLFQSWFVDNVWRRTLPGPIWAAGQASSVDASGTSSDVLSSAARLKGCLSTFAPAGWTEIRVARKEKSARNGKIKRAKVGRREWKGERLYIVCGSCDAREAADRVHCIVERQRQPWLNNTPHIPTQPPTLSSQRCHCHTRARTRRRRRQPAVRPAMASASTSPTRAAQQEEEDCTDTAADSRPCGTCPRRPTTAPRATTAARRRRAQA